MTSNKVARPKYVLSRHLSLSAMFAGMLAEDRGHSKIEPADYIASCYIADPIRFLGFWMDSLTCIEALSLDCGVIDPVWTYQWKLTEKIKSALDTLNGGHSYIYAPDLAECLQEAADLVGRGIEEPQI